MKMSLKRSRIAYFCAVSAALFALATPTAATASPPRTLEAGARYVALGSSYAAGGGISNPDPADRYGCGRSLDSYPYLISSSLGLNLTMAACGGATAANIASEPQVVRGFDGSSTSVPLQADALGADTQLVTITVGGNDVGFVGQLYARGCRAVLQANPSDPTANAFQQYGMCTPPSDADTQSALSRVQGNIVSAIRAVQNKASNARILLVDYLTVVPNNTKPCASLPLTREDLRYVRDLARDLAASTARAARATGVELVAMSNQSSAHDACSKDPWTTGWDFTPGLAAMHPNKAGHAAVAAAILRQLRIGR